jgi:kynureninase
MTAGSEDMLVEMDRQDPLAAKTAAFDVPVDQIYLDGNSLGCLPMAAKQRAREVVEQQWGQDLIKSWNLHQWIDLPFSAGDKIARLIGAAPGQTICCDSISVNIFKLLSAALMMQTGRHVVLSQQGNFPTDLYMVQGLARQLGEDRCSLRLVADDDIASALTDDVAVLLLSHVNFRSGALYDMQAITEQAQARGDSGDLGPGAQCRRCACAAGCLSRRFCCRVRLQIPEWWSRRPGISVRGPAAPGAGRSAIKWLDGPYGAI